MPSLQEIEAEVDSLDSLTSNIFRFRDAFAKIETASQTETDIARLRNILILFRDKIPDLVAFNRLRADAKDLAEILMLNSLENRLSRIKARNDLLSELTDELQTEIDKANDDASLLSRIKQAVQKATSTVNEVKDLINQLTATDASTRDRITALLESLGNISSILHPENA